MPSNVDPHGVPLHACVHSRTAQGSWPKAAVTLSLNPFLPCRPADQPRRRTGLSQHVASEAVQLEGSVARWHDVGNCFDVKLEDTAHYAGLLLAPAKGFGLGFFCLSGKKESLLCCFGPFLAIFVSSSYFVNFQ